MGPASAGSFGFYREEKMNKTKTVVATLIAALSLSMVLNVSVSTATPPVDYNNSRLAGCQGLQFYAQNWMNVHGFGTINYRDAGPNYVTSIANSFVRDDGDRWRVQCQWRANAAPGYHNPYAAPGDESLNFARVAATYSIIPTVSNGAASYTIPSASINFFYMNWADPGCLQCWEDVPYGTRQPYPFYYPW